MKWLESRVLWGSLLIVGGVLFLLQSLGILLIGDLFWGTVLGLAGVFFFSVYIQNRENWWALIPGFTLFSVALVVILGWLVPVFTENWGGALVLGGIGVSFLVIYVVERELWWILIPAGVMLTLAVVAGLEELTPGSDTSGVFFLGLGATFGALALTSTPSGHMSWAWIPAGILTLMGLLIMIAFENLIAYLWPLALIVLGGFIVFRAMRAR